MLITLPSCIETLVVSIRMEIFPLLFGPEEAEAAIVGGMEDNM
jgi:hypothetical protein